MKYICHAWIINKCKLYNQVLLFITLLNDDYHFIPAIDCFLGGADAGVGNSSLRTLSEFDYYSIRSSKCFSFVAIVLWVH